MPDWQLEVEEDFSGGTDGNSIDGQTTSDGNGTWEVTNRDLLYDTGGPDRVDGDTGSRSHQARLGSVGNNQRFCCQPDNQFAGPMVRQQADGTGYALVAISKFGEWKIYRVDGTLWPFSDWTVLESTGVNRGGSDIAMLEVVGQNPGTLKAYADSSNPPTTQIGSSADDSDYDDGGPGMHIYSTSIHIIGPVKYFRDDDEGGGGGGPTVVRKLSTIETIYGAVVAQDILEGAS